MNNWEFFSKRRKITLAEFVKGSKNYHEALRIFERLRVEPPQDESLRALFENNQAHEDSTQQVVSVSESEASEPEVSEPEVSESDTPLEKPEIVDSPKKKKTPEDFGIRKKPDEQ